jgi:hypothetical protein
VVENGTILARIDDALYAAKAAGRNAVVGASARGRATVLRHPGAARVKSGAAAVMVRKSS